MGSHDEECCLLLKTEVNRDVECNGNDAHNILGSLWKWHCDLGEREMGTHQEGKLPNRNLLLGESMKNSLDYLFRQVSLGHWRPVGAAAAL